MGIREFVVGVVAGGVGVAIAILAGCSDAQKCTGGTVACGGACVDLRLDPGNCGACGRACDSAEVCSVSTCAAACLAGTLSCDGRCTDMATDRKNCGACGHACGGGEVCAGGACTASCDPLTACSGQCVDLQTDEHACGACDVACPQGQFCIAGACTQSPIQHVVLIVEENHTFDSYFGAYCTAPAGSNPTCTTGASCCEAAPALEPSGAAPIVLDDFNNELEDRDHDAVCEVAQIDGGLMDHYVVGSGVTVGAIEGLYTYDCSDPHNFAVADGTTIQPYWNYATTGALADRYFQPIIGQTSSNDMYLAVAHYVFTDNAERPNTVGGGCTAPGTDAIEYAHQATVADLIINNGYTFRMYADGYGNAVASAPLCPSAAGTYPADCESFERTSPYSLCNYDPSDLGFQYYEQLADKYIVDYTQLQGDVAAGALPNFAYVKFATYRNEHPKWSNISRGVTLVQSVVDLIEGSQYANDTLILLVWDEGGGFYDHVAPPQPVPVQNDADANGQPVAYGTRVPLLVLGRFARVNEVSHTPLEHSSIVKFLEANFLGPRYVGALGHRDAVVANLGSLLDPATTGVIIGP